MDRIFEAVEFAQKAHQGQYRKGSSLPYIVHPISVMESLILEGCSEEVAIAGLLHDVIEDTPYSGQDIWERFGERIARLVECVSEPDRSLSWQERKDHTIAYFENCQDLDVLHIFCADKLHNMQSMVADYARIGEELWRKYNAPKEKQKWYYTTIANILMKHSQKKDDIFERYYKLTTAFFNKVI